MLDFFFAFLAMLAADGEEINPGGNGTAAASRPALVAEEQDATGKFTTATEVKPILNMTQGNWVALGEVDEEDLLYVTHLWSWRCGLAQVRIGINDTPPSVWDFPACHTGTARPNAILQDDGLPYRAFPLNSVNSVTVELVYDDLTEASARFERNDILMQ